MARLLKIQWKCVTNWTHLFAERDVTYELSIIDHCISFVEYMSCNAETYTSHGGSNGCADQLTNWDGTKKLGLGSQTKKKGQSYWSYQSNKVESDLQQIVPASRSLWLKCSSKSKKLPVNWLYFKKYDYLCVQNLTIQNKKIHRY